MLLRHHSESSSTTDSDRIRCGIPYPCNRLQSFSSVLTNVLHSWSLRSENSSATCSLYSMQRGESWLMTLSESSITVANSSNRCRELGNGLRQSRSHSRRLSVRASCQTVAHKLHLVRECRSERAAHLCHGRWPCAVYRMAELAAGSAGASEDSNPARSGELRKLRRSDIQTAQRYWSEDRRTP